MTEQKIKFEKNQAYMFDNKLAYFLGEIDGINIFELKVDTKLYCFYFYKTKSDILNLEKIDKKYIEIFKEDELPIEDISKAEGKKIELSEDEFFRFIFTAKPPFPNGAFCPHNMLEELFERRGKIYSESDDITLAKKYRAVYPDYCLIKDGYLYRQTDLREDYPDLVLEFTKFDKDTFLKTAKYKDLEKIYLSAQSVEKYGGKHKEFADWQKKVIGKYEDFFQNAKMTKHKRHFVIREDKIWFFKKLKLDESKMWILKLAV